MHQRDPLKVGSQQSFATKQAATNTHTSATYDIAHPAWNACSSEERLRTINCSLASIIYGMAWHNGDNNNNHNKAVFSTSICHFDFNN